MASNQNMLDYWDDILPVPRLSKRASILLITFLSAGSYIISIDGDFVFDDSEAIVNNKDVKLVNPINEIFLNDFWGTRLIHNQSHKSYRPITVLSFRLNVWLNKGVLSSYQFRLLNILLHSVVCVLSIKVFELLMGGKCNKAANLCAIIFSVHPVHTEAVAGIVGRAELLCAAFSFISVILYNKAVDTLKYVHSMFYTLLSIVFISLAMFSKEQGITMLGVCFVYDILVVNRMYLKIYFNKFFINFRISNKIKASNIYPLTNNEIQKISNGFITSKMNQNNKSCNTVSSNSIKNTQTNLIMYLILLRFILLLIAGLLLLFVRWHIMDGIPPTFQKVDNLSSFMDNFIFRVINYSYVYALNCWLLLCPVWLCFDWSMGCVPLIESFNDSRLIFVILFWISIICLCLRPLFVACFSRINSNIAMGLSFMIISFLPASNLFFRVGFVIAERVLYLPSVGYCILLTTGLQQLMLNIIVLNKNSLLQYQSIYFKITSLLFWFLIIVMYSGKSVLRSYEWRTEYSLFRSALSVCPLNAKVHYNMGKVTVNKTLSLNYYKQAIRLNPEYDQAMNNLANLLKDDGNLDEAEELLRRSIKLRPNFAAAWMNLGIVLSNKKQFVDAEFAFLEAVKYRKHYPDCYYNLGNLYVDQKLYNEAELSWRKATSQKPNHSIAWNNLIIMLDSIGKYKEAESTALEALYILPTDPGIHFNLANTLGKLSRFNEAEKHFKIAIELNSNQALYFVNLGVLYHRWKMYQEAKEMYKRALIINPNLESAERNLKMLS